MLPAPIVLARFGITKWMVGGSFLGLVAVSVTVLVLLTVLGIVVRWMRNREPAGLRRLGYRASGKGKYSWTVDQLKVEFHPPGRWTTRMAVYGTVDLRLEPRKWISGSQPGKGISGSQPGKGISGSQPGKGRPPPDDGFVTGDELLDDRFCLWSDRPPFAKQVLHDVRVRDALLALRDPSVVLRGDELVVELRRTGTASHEAVADLARATAAVLATLRTL